MRGSGARVPGEPGLRRALTHGIGSGVVRDGRRRIEFAPGPGEACRGRTCPVPSRIHARLPDGRPQGSPLHGPHRIRARFRTGRRRIEFAPGEACRGRACPVPFLPLARFRDGRPQGSPLHGPHRIRARSRNGRRRIECCVPHRGEDGVTRVGAHSSERAADSRTATRDENDAHETSCSLVSTVRDPRCRQLRRRGSFM